MTAARRPGRTPQREMGGRPLLVALRALGLGDFLTGLPALRALARAFPVHRRVLAAPRVLGALLELDGSFHEIADTPGLVALDRDLRGPDIAVDLHGRGPLSQPRLIELGPRRLVCFAHRGVAGTEHGSEWRAGEHEVVRWCRLLSEHGIPSDPSDLRLAPPPETGGRSGRTLVHPGAAYPARRWPPERFAAVAAGERRNGRPVVVTAGPGEEPLARRVADLAGLGSEAVRAGMGLRRLAAEVAGASRVVCGDTGVAHLATALGTASVVLFGPVSPALWGPPPRQGRHLALWAGRCGDPWGEEVDAGLLEITVADVVAALARLPRPEPVPDPDATVPPARPGRSRTEGQSITAEGARREGPGDRRAGTVSLDEAARPSRAAPLAARDLGG